MIGHYLMFDRTCAQALEFYARAFNGKITVMQKYGDMPPNPNFPVADSDRDLVLHATLRICDAEIMAADSSGRTDNGNNMYVTVTIADRGLAESAWKILSQGGDVYMDLAPSFFAALHGSLKDKFGINWMFTVPK